jgi:hypothetical protein
VLFAVLARSVDLCAAAAAAPALQVALLKQWVTDSSLEDDEFFKLSQNSKTKKTDWVKYVKQKLS